MKVVYTTRASQTLDDIVDFIDDINTEDAGKRWLVKILAFVKDYAQPNVKYNLCHNESFALKGFSCIAFNNWIFVFKIEDDEFVVYEVVYGPSLF